MPELSAFYAAAATHGAYEEQADSGDAAHAALAALAETSSQQAITGLEEFILELARLLINISCRINLRNPEKLRPLRTRLSGLRRRAILTLRSLGVSDPAARAKAASSTSPRRIANLGVECELLDELGPRHLCDHGCFFREYEP